MLLRNMWVNAIETIEQNALKVQNIHVGTIDTMPKTPKQLLEELDRLHITYEIHSHPPLHTVEESQELRGKISGGHCKNLFLKDKKGELWLVVCLEDAQINMKTLNGKIGSARLSFGRPELLFEILGVTPGSVTPFALINDSKTRVNVILDQKMMAFETLNYHPLTNEQTLTIHSENLAVFINACGHQPHIVDIS
jgi:Ala-tRNA(Pro) deacylase